MNFFYHTKIGVRDWKTWLCRVKTTTKSINQSINQSKKKISKCAEPQFRTSQFNSPVSVSELFHSSTNFPELYDGIWTVRLEMFQTRFNSRVEKTKRAVLLETFPDVPHPKPPDYVINFLPPARQDYDCCSTRRAYLFSFFFFSHSLAGSVPSPVSDLGRPSSRGLCGLPTRSPIYCVTSRSAVFTTSCATGSDKEGKPRRGCWCLVGELRCQIEHGIDVDAWWVSHRCLSFFVFN